MRAKTINCRIAELRLMELHKTHGYDTKRSQISDCRVMGKNMEAIELRARDYGWYT